MRYKLTLKLVFGALFSAASFIGTTFNIIFAYTGKPVKDTLALLNFPRITNIILGMLLISVPIFILSTLYVILELRRQKKAYYNELHCLCPIEFSDLQGTWTAEGTGTAVGVDGTYSLVLENFNGILKLEDERHGIFMLSLNYKWDVYNGNTYACSLNPYDKSQYKIKLEREGLNTFSFILPDSNNKLYITMSSKTTGKMVEMGDGLINNRPFSYKLEYQITVS